MCQCFALSDLTFVTFTICTQILVCMSHHCFNDSGVARGATGALALGATFRVTELTPKGKKWTNHLLLKCTVVCTKVVFNRKLYLNIHFRVQNGYCALKKCWGMVRCTWKRVMKMENDGAFWTVYLRFAKKNCQFCSQTNFLQANQKTKFSHRGAILYFLPQAPQMLATPLFIDTVYCFWNNGKMKSLLELKCMESVCYNYMQNSDT